MYISNTNVRFHFTFLLILCCFIIGGCLDDNFEIPSLKCVDKIEVANKKNISVDSIRLFAILNPDTPYNDEEYLEGYVISSDKEGNFYKSLIILTDNTGIRINIDKTNLYSEYDIGRKVTINLQNIFPKINYDEIVLEDEEGSLSYSLISEQLYRMCETKTEQELTTKVTIREINDNHLNRLIEIDSVQFINEALHTTFYDSNEDLGGSTNRFIEDKDGYNLIVRTSAYADFSETQIPKGNGTIKGILTKYRDDYQLIPRYVLDVNLTSNRKLWDRMSIGALKLKEQDIPLNDSRFIEGIVTLSGYTENPINSRNLSPRLAIIQDENDGIALYFDEDQHELIKGQEVRIFLHNHNLDTYAGQMRLETIDFDSKNQSGIKYIQIISENNPLPQPKLTSIEEILKGNHQLERVTVADVQFVGEHRGLSISGDKTITDCKDILNIYTRSASLLSNQIIPSERGLITGIASYKSQIVLLLTSEDDLLNLNEERCYENTMFFEENFENISKTGNGIFIDLENWTNISANGGILLWEAQSYAGNKYAQISAYKTNEVMESWLITPEINLDETVDEYLQFKTKDAYNNGNPLSVFVSQNFDGENIDSATWIPLDVTIAQGTTYGYADSFTDSGKIDLNQYQGNIVVAFVYKGDSKAVTTTIQLDEVQVFGKYIQP